MKIFPKAVVCASLLFLAKGVEAQNPSDVRQLGIGYGAAAEPRFRCRYRVRSAIRLLRYCGDRLFS